MRNTKKERIYSLVWIWHQKVTSPEAIINFILFFWTKCKLKHAIVSVFYHLFPSLLSFLSLPIVFCSPISLSPLLLLYTSTSSFSHFFFLNNLERRDFPWWEYLDTNFILYFWDVVMLVLKSSKQTSSSPPITNKSLLYESAFNIDFSLQEAWNRAKYTNKNQAFSPVAAPQHGHVL